MRVFSRIFYLSLAITLGTASFAEVSYAQSTATAPQQKTGEAHSSEDDLVPYWGQDIPAVQRPVKIIDKRPKPKNRKAKRELKPPKNIPVPKPPKDAKFYKVRPKKDDGPSETTPSK